MESIDKLDLKSLNISEDKKSKLKELFPEVFSEDKIDFDKLKLTLGEDIADNEERFGLQWAGKKDCFKVIQEPSVGTLKPCKEESVNWDTTENLFIEGDNLEVLKQLQKAYYGKVKMIYIDPPYNTGGEFIYPDRFQENLDTYLAYTGQVNDEGKKFSTNTETSGRFHSNWLNMMYPRLFLARNLLKNDGIIFISIDDNEVDNLNKICNEIFGEENFVSMFIHKNNSSKNQAKLVSISTEYFFCYSKNKEFLKDTTWRLQKKGAGDIAKKYNELKNNGLSLDEINNEIKEMYKRPKYSHLSRWNKVDEKGVFKDADLSREGGKKDYTIINPKTGVKCVIPNRGWGKSYEELLRLQKEDLIWYGSDDTPPGMKDYIDLDDVSVPDNFWYYDNSVDTRWIKNEFGDLVFENPKPLEMLKSIISLHTNDNDIVLDFFAGSGTTAHAVLDLNKEDNQKRKFICIQLPEPTLEKSFAYKSNFKNIAEVSKERIRKAILSIKSESKKNEGKIQFEDDNLIQDLGFKVFKLDRSNFKTWDGNTENDGIQNQLEKALFHIDTKSSEEDILTEILLKSGFQLTVKMEEITLAAKKVFSIADGSLIVCLDKDITKELIQEIAKLEPARVVCLDSGFKERDELKTNAIQIMKSHGVDDFRTV
jgi:adenine-specific DNA-methyltransferase